MAKLLFGDVETSGLDPKRNALIQLAGLVVIDGQEKERFNFSIQPFETDVVEDSALAVNNISREQLKGFMPPAEAYGLFCEVLGRYVDKFNGMDKFFLVGYNARFDYDFMRAWFEKCRDKYFGSWFFFPPIDVMNLAALRLMEERPKMLNFKLATVVDWQGIKTKLPLHDAMTDILLTKELFDMYSGGAI